MYDLCVIGGGAAGISCAISAGRLGLKVLLVDKNNKLGKKLYATGNGKCNLANAIFDNAKHYNSNNTDYVDFLHKSLDKSYNHKEPTNQLIDYMDSIGINTVCDNNYIYPNSAQASSVVWAMLDELKAHNIEIRLNTEILSIEGRYPSFEIKSKNEAFKASQIVLSCGGAAYKSLGGTYSGYSLAKASGHIITDIIPCLCGLKIDEDLQDVAGVRANSTIRLYNQDKIIASSTGELQITNQGLSGICIFELSSKAGRLLKSGNKPRLSISLLNQTSYRQLIQHIQTESFGERTAIGLLNGYVNDKLATYVCKLNNIDGKIKAKVASKEQLLKLANTLNSLEFTIIDLYDMEQAQLTAGGVEISQINPETMESTLVEGMYIVGELLDIDGICGGYNLTFAMLSGYKSGKSVYDKNKSN